MLAGVLAAAALVGCSGDDSALDDVTTTSFDEAELAQERLCESLASYTDQEDRPPAAPRTPVGEGGETTTPPTFDDPRLGPLLRFEAALPEDAPDEVHAAVARMRELRSQPLGGTSTTAATPEPSFDEVFAPVFEYLDPMCDTVDGRAIGDDDGVPGNTVRPPRDVSDDESSDSDDADAGEGDGGEGDGGASENGGGDDDPSSDGDANGGPAPAEEGSTTTTVA